MTGFSLVELSIVLVILGLLTGGILGGQALIKAAEMRATIKQLEEYQLAVNGFRLKYNATPGDFTDATRFWGAETEDGDGDGYVECQFSHKTPDRAYYEGERPQFFIQLNLAGLIARSFDGSRILDAGYPAIKMRPSYGMFVSGPWEMGATNIPDLPTYFKGKVYMSMMVCQPSFFESSNSQFNDHCGVFTPTELWQIDTKMDDGTALGGKLIAQSTNTQCLSSGEFRLNVDATNCNAMYELVR